MQKYGKDTVTLPQILALVLIIQDKTLARVRKGNVCEMSPIGTGS